MRKDVGVFSWQGLMGAVAVLLLVAGASWVQGGPLFLAPGSLTALHPQGMSAEWRHGTRRL